MTEQPFFVAEGGAYLPTRHCAGYWTPDSISGRVVIGLLGFEIERLHGAADFQPVRLTVDIYRMPTRAPLTIATRAVREGGRIKVIDAELFSSGVSIARATAQLLRRTANPPGDYPQTPNWDAPPPTAVAEAVDRQRPWDMRPIVGGIGTPWPRRMWVRETRELVGGYPLTPFVRVAAAVDVASPYANSGDAGAGYINPDVTLYLSRLPGSQWVGFEARHHTSTEGVAVGECALYDETGPIGFAAVAGLAQRAPSPET